MLLGQQAAFHKGDGHVDRARPLLQRCYDIERGVDPQSLTTAGAAEALAGVLQNLGEYDEARRLLEESLSIQTVCASLYTSQLVSASVSSRSKLGNEDVSPDLQACPQLLFFGGDTLATRHASPRLVATWLRIFYSCVFARGGDESGWCMRAGHCLLQVRRRNAIPADQMLRLVNLEMKVATPDSFLRAHNMAQRCCDSVESLIQKYDAITAGQTGWVGRWFGPKAASQEQIEKVHHTSLRAL